VSRNSLKLLLAIVLALVLGLAGTACGDDDDTSSGDTATTTDGGNGDDDDLSGGLSDQCAEIAGVSAGLAAALSTAGGLGQVKEQGDLLTELGERGPSEIRADLGVLADAFKKIADAIEEAGIDPTASSVPPDQAAQAAQVFAQLAGEIDQERLQSASENIRGWMEENCGADTGSDS
jgi:hypothetical protein